MLDILHYGILAFIGLWLLLFSPVVLAKAGGAVIISLVVLKALATTT